MNKKLKLILKISGVWLAIVFGLAFYPARAHGPAGGASGSIMMTRMMEVMHSNFDKNQATSCSSVSDAEMMESGEKMMEEMMGSEDHEKFEGAISEKAHDDTHTMMGMWATGCVGDEVLNAIAGKYGFESGMMGLNGTRGRFGWSEVAVALIIGVAGGVIGSRIMRKKSE
ncbi:MAG: hypothetical protein HYV52_01735 [Parcubacteria group bacterium]|nr:hypothetical protein [Parcubacteria group bacterium]